MENTIHNCSHHIGIDISKQWLDCWLRKKKQYQRCKNNHKGHKRLIRWLYQQGCRPQDSLICMENTGVYGKQLVAALTQEGWACGVEKTTVLKRIAPEHHRKEDRYDAQLLAEYAQRYQDQLHLQKPVVQAIEQMRQLYGERSRLVRQRAATKTKRKQANHQISCPALLERTWKQQLSFYAQEIQALELALQQLINDRQDLNDYYQLLVGIPGVGQVTAWLWLILFYGRGKLNAKKIASRFGFAPHRHRSGSSVRGKTRSSGHGLAQMRRNMTLAARSASTHYRRFASYKCRKIEEGKPWPVVRNNIINQLITLICVIWNSKKQYNPEHISRFNQQKTLQST